MSDAYSKTKDSAQRFVYGKESWDNSASFEFLSVLSFGNELFQELTYSALQKTFHQKTMWLLVEEEDASVLYDACPNSLDILSL